MICAICWNPSNLLGLFLSLRSQFQVAPVSTSLLILMGPKCKNSSSNFDALYSLFGSCGFSSVQIISFSSPFHRLLVSICPFLFYPKLLRYSLTSDLYFYLSTPANPPLSTGLLWFRKYYYGDGIGVRPVLNYQWQPSILSSSFRSFLRRACLSFSYYISNCFTTNFDVSSGLLDLTRISELFIKFTRAVHYSQLTGFKASVSPDRKNIFLVVMSALSPSRISFENEILLYTDYLNLQMRNISVDNSVIYLKFHYHHDANYRNSFLSRMRVSLPAILIEEAPSSFPAESIALFLSDSFSCHKVVVFAFQESARLLKGISSAGSRFSFCFGFPVELVEKYFHPSEVHRRIQYQINARNRFC